MINKGPRRDAEKERFWRAAIRRQRRNGQSVRVFCREEDLSEPSFYAWRREIARRGRQRAEQRLRRSGKQAAFVAVELAPESEPVPQSVSAAGAGGHGSAAAPERWSLSIECVLPSGVVLRLPTTMEPAAIAAVLRCWERSPC